MKLEWMDSLLQILLDSQKTEISVILLTKHLSSIICALLYACFSPKSSQIQVIASLSTCYTTRTLNIPVMILQLQLSILEIDKKQNM